MIITIDGPAGAGKSSVAHRVAAELGYCYLDTGAMYRAVTWVFLQQRHHEAPVEEHVAEQVLRTLGMRINREGRVWLQEEEVTDRLRTPEVTAWVSPISALPVVRRAMVDLQREAADRFTEEGQGLVVEGRDTGSYVFPHAGRRIYLDASIEERARRRQAQDGGDGALQSWVDRIRDRDQQDRGRDLAPLRIPEGAVVVNTTEMSEDEVVSRILEVVAA